MNGREIIIDDRITKACSESDFWTIANSGVAPKAPPAPLFDKNRELSFAKFVGIPVTKDLPQ